MWLVLQNKARPDLSPPLVISNIGDLNQMNSGVYCVPLWLGEDGLVLNGDGMQRRLNVSGGAQSYLKRLGANVQDLFHHVLAVLHDSTYNQVNADALRAEGPRIPLLAWPDGGAEGAAETLAKSAARGCQLARLLDDSMRPCRLLRKHPYARRALPSPCPPRGPDATWAARISQ